MFELYFGAFDIVLYAVAFLVALYVADEICTRAEQAQMVPALATVAPCPSIERCPMRQKPIAPVAIGRLPVKAVSPAPTLVAIEPDSQEPPVTNEEMTAQDKSTLRLADIKIYKLHKKSVVKVSALPFDVPDKLKQYSLRGEPVVRLEALEKEMEVPT